MVVATPCPLILAAPIALVGGLSRAARAGVIVKGAGVLERLGDTGTVLLDKTGTVTSGDPEVERIVVTDGLPADEALRLAASLDQLSAHVLAESLVRAATGRGLRLSTPERVEEEPGRGIVGLVEGRGVAVGSSGWLEERGYTGARARALELDDDEGAGRAKILVGVDGELQAVLVMTAASGGVKGSGFVRMESGIPIFPMSWNSAAVASAPSCLGESRISRPIASEMRRTRCE